MSRGWDNFSLQRWRFLLPLGVGLLGVLLILPTRLGETVARSSYDWLHQLAGLNSRALANSPVLLIYLDRDSFQVLGQPESQPLPASPDRAEPQVLRTSRTCCRDCRPVGTNT